MLPNLQTFLDQMRIKCPRSEASDLVDFPEEFKWLLTEMTYNYLQERPTDEIDFIVEYLSQKKKESVSVFYSSVNFQDDSSIKQDRRARKASILVQNPQNNDPSTAENFNPPYFAKTPIEMTKLRNSVIRSGAFQILKEDLFNTTLGAMWLLHVKKGKIVVQEGKCSKYFYVVEEGIFEETREVFSETIVHKLHDNRGFFVDHALIFNAPSLFTVKAKTKGKLWVLGRNTYLKVLDADSKQSKKRSYSALLDGLLVFSFLTPDERDQVTDLLLERTFRPGAIIFNEGEEGDGMYFIVSGKVSVARLVRGSEREVAQLISGDFFGELALLTHLPRSATVYAKTTVVLAFLDVTDFENILGRYTNILKRNLNLYRKELKHLFRMSIRFEDLR